MSYVFSIVNTQRDSSSCTAN